MKERIRGLLVALLFFVIILSSTINAYATESVLAEGMCGYSLSWKITGNENERTLTISGSGNMYDYTDASATPWAGYTKEIQKIVIENGATCIGDNAFEGCSNLKSVSLPNSLRMIGWAAFDNCSSLTDIVLPSSLNFVNRYAFSSCSSLESIAIPNGVEYIYDGVFQCCSSLKSVTLPRGLISIGKYSFADCRSLVSIIIPEGVDAIDSFAFEKCSSMKNVTIPDSVTEIGSCAFSDCSGLESITIPDSVTIMGNQMFQGCNGLTDVKMPANISEIKSGTFLGCTSLESITIPENVDVIGSVAFYNCSSLSNIVFPFGLTDIETKAFFGCSNLKSITVPSSVNSIGDQVFPNSCVMKVYRSSYAETYAINNNLIYITICNTHIWNDFYTVDKEATFYDEGIESIHCSLCGEIKEGSSRAIEKIVRTNLAGLCIKEDNTMPSFLVDNGNQHTNTIGIGYDPVIDPATTRYVSKIYEGTKTFINVWVEAADNSSTIKVYPVNNVGNNPFYTNNDGTILNVGNNGKNRFPVYWMKGQTSAEIKIVIDPLSEDEGPQKIYDVILIRSERHIDVGRDPLLLQIDYISGDNKTIKYKAICGDKDVTTDCNWYTDNHEIAEVDKGLLTVHDLDGEIVLGACYGTQLAKLSLKVDEGVLSDEDHTYSDWKIIKNATCTETGLKERVCNTCGLKDSEEMPLIDHKWSTEYTVDRKATYGAAGLKTIHCSECGTIKPNSEVSIPKLKVKTPIVSRPIAIKKGFYIKWRKVSGVNGYEIQYALNSKFSKSKKIVKIKRAANISKKITKLKVKKKYYVRIRAYKVINRKVYYSTWCKTRKVITKK